MKRWLPNRDTLRNSRWLAPIAHHLEDDRLWHFERGSVARAVAIGLFFGVLMPFAQIVFAVITAIWLRSHVAVAAAATFVTNPLTFPPIYWLAYRIGRRVLGEPDDEQTADAIEAQAEAATVTKGWLTAVWDTVQSAGLPLMVGLASIAVIASLIGYVVVWLLWRPHEPPEDEDPPP